MYSASVAQREIAMRRDSRRRIVGILYLVKSMPVRPRSCARKALRTSGSPIFSSAELSTASDAITEPIASMSATRSTKFGGIDSGSAGKAALSGSCTMTMPPASLTAAAPSAPSLPMPLSTTAITQSPYASAALLKSRSMEG